MQIQTKTKITEIQTTTIDTITIKTIDTIMVAINKITDTTTIAVHQICNKTGTTQINNHVDIVTEQITSPGIVKFVLIAEEWDICHTNEEHPYKIKTLINKFRMLTKSPEISNKSATPVPLSNKIL